MRHEFAPKDDVRLSREVFLANCARYHESRQKPGATYQAKEVAEAVSAERVEAHAHWTKRIAEATTAETDGCVAAAADESLQDNRYGDCCRLTQSAIVTAIRARGGK